MFISMTKALLDLLIKEGRLEVHHLVWKGGNWSEIVILIGKCVNKLMVANWQIQKISLTKYKVLGMDEVESFFMKIPDDVIHQVSNNIDLIKVSLELFRPPHFFS